MKKISSLKIVLSILGLSSVASLVGSISGTIAWYAYSTRALVSYSGTSVQSTTQLQIGIKSDIVVTKFTTESKFLNLVEDITFDNDNNHYYFMKAGAGGMPAMVINTYLEAKGYTTNILEPLSSYTYRTGGDFNLRNRPQTNKPYEEYTAAETTKYAEIPFVFRVLSSDSSTGPVYVGGQEIFLSGAEAVAASDEDGNINESIRLYIDRSDEYNTLDANNQPISGDFIFNPNKEDRGSTKVSGILNLTGLDGSGDGYYDYDNTIGSQTLGQECLYGEYDFVEEKSTFAESIENCLTDPDVEPASTNIVNINGWTYANGQAPVAPGQNTFVSKHYPGVKYFKDLSGITPHYAEYLGKNQVFPQRNQNGELESDYPLCKTATTGNKMGSFNMKIYIEGWDFSVIDDELEHEFYLGLTFQINIVR